MMPHLHLSFQSGDDMILKRMKRRHSRADAVAFLRRRLRAARPDIAFGADLIAGFPTETDGHVREHARTRSTSAASTICTCSRIRRGPARRPRGCRRLPRDVVKARAARLRAERRRARWRCHLQAQVGREVELLMEGGPRCRTSPRLRIEVALADAGAGRAPLRARRHAACSDVGGCRARPHRSYGGARSEHRPPEPARPVRTASTTGRGAGRPHRLSLDQQSLPRKRPRCSKRRADRR